MTCLVQVQCSTAIMGIVNRVHRGQRWYMTHWERSRRVLLEGVGFSSDAWIMKPFQFSLHCYPTLKFTFCFRNLKPSLKKSHYYRKQLIFCSSLNGIKILQSLLNCVTTLRVVCHTFTSHTKFVHNDPFSELCI